MTGFSSSLAPSLTPDLIGAFLTFAIVSSVTPGPNNAMLVASGANFGFRATVPHLLGVVSGFLTLMLVVGLGLGGLFTAYPVLHLVLAWVGTAYLLYLAVRIALSDKLSTAKGGAKPLSFRQAFAFQAVNPKGWAMAVGAMTAYAPQTHYLANVLAIAVMMTLINIPNATFWTAFGLAMRRFLGRPAVLRAFNIGMGLLLALSLIPGLKDLIGAK